MRVRGNHARAPSAPTLQSAPDEQLTWSGGSLLGALRRSASYHSLAGLNLEGAAAAEASIKQGEALAAPCTSPAGPLVRRRRCGTGSVSGR